MLEPRRRSRYCSYLLRCVQQQAHPEPPQWRFSLEDARTGERRAFASLDALLKALHYEFSDAGSQPFDGSSDEPTTLEEGAR